MRLLAEWLWVPLSRAVAAQALKTVQRPDAVSREAACGRKASALSSSACRKLGKIADHTPATTSAPTPPYTVARTAPPHPPPPPGRGKLRRRAGDDHAEGARPPRHKQGAQRERQAVREAENHRSNAKDGHANKQAQAGLAAEGKTRH